MYIPAAFAEHDRDRLYDFIDAYGFGTIITTIDGTPFATHLPMLLDRTSAPQGRLLGHLARANPHWQHLTASPSLAIFTGPHAYISPRWYEAEHVVPTWNYTAVHVTGTIRLIEDRDALREMVTAMTAQYESSAPQPWVLKDEGPFLDRMLAQIVGFEMTINMIEGKFKLNQNHPVERQRKVITALRATGGDDRLTMAKMMEARLSRGEGS